MVKCEDEPVRIPAVIAACGLVLVFVSGCSSSVPPPDAPAPHVGDCHNGGTCAARASTMDLLGCVGHRNNHRLNPDAVDAFLPEGYEREKSPTTVLTTEIQSCQNIILDNATVLHDQAFFWTVILVIPPAGLEGPVFNVYVGEWLVTNATWAHYLNDHGFAASVMEFQKDAVAGEVTYDISVPGVLSYSITEVDVPYRNSQGSEEDVRVHSVSAGQSYAFDVLQARPAAMSVGQMLFDGEGGVTPGLAASVDGKTNGVGGVGPTDYEFDVVAFG